MQGKVIVEMDVDIEYKGAGKSYYYRAHYTFDSSANMWVFDDGDAN
jgi:hypothetical protein